MISVDFETVAQLAAGRGLNTVLEGFALAALSWTTLKVFRASSSMTRFAVWFSTLLVIAGLPFLSFGGPPRLPSRSHMPELTLRSGWAMGIFLAWAVIASALLLRLVVSLVHLYRVRRASREVDSGWIADWAEVAGKFAGRPVKLLVSDEVRVPAAFGFFHPAVVIPRWALSDLSPDERKVIVLHELAHLRRWDDWTNLLQQILKALFFFHPAVWWLDGRLAFEREIACDDLVLERTSSARAYAASLVSVAEKVVAERMRMGRALELAQSALGRMGEVSARIMRILDGRRPSHRGWRPAVAMIGTLAVVTVGAMPYAPELVSFNKKLVSSDKKAEPAFSAESRGVSSTQVVPATLRWSQTDRTVPMRITALRASTRSRGKDAGFARGSGLSSPLVVSAKAMVNRVNPTAKVVMTKADDETRPAETLVVFRSAEIDRSGTPVWTLAMWRVTRGDGQMVQELIVMNSI
jgi:Zn-dependent protease with chaperone function